MWSLLPSFCTDPVDISKAFRPLARILGTALKEKAELRPVVCQGLNQLISKSAKHGMVDVCSHPVTCGHNALCNFCYIDEEKATLACFSKNFLPILFNLYATPPKGVEAGEGKALLLDCAKAYVSITGVGVCMHVYGGGGTEE